VASKPTIDPKRSISQIVPASSDLVQLNIHSSSSAVAVSDATATDHSTAKLVLFRKAPNKAPPLFVPENLPKYPVNVSKELFPDEAEQARLDKGDARETLELAERLRVRPCIVQLSYAD